MSDGPTPSNWETAAPSLLWGVFAFAFGFEGVAMLFEGKLVLAIIGIIAAIVLTGIAMQWKRVAKLSPRLSKTAALIATDARVWVGILMVLFVPLTWGGFASSLMGGVGPGSSDSDRVAWNMEQTVRGGGYFLNMTKTNDQEIRVLGFQAHGKNNSNGPISQFSGYMRSDLTNAQRPIYILAQDIDESKIPVCVPRIPTLPQETFGIPAFAEFDIATYEKLFFEPGKDGVPVSKFINNFAPFTLVLEYDGTRVVRRFSREEVNKQIEIFEKSLSLQSIPRVLRKADATPPIMSPLPTLLKATPVPPASLPPLKLLIPPADQDTPTGKIPSKE